MVYYSKWIKFRDSFKLQVGRLLCLLAILCITGCDDHAWNDPYPKQLASSNILYSAFAEQPNHLDPAISYSSNEWTFIGQIYEPPLQYHYLKRPYKLEPLSAQNIPQASYNAQTNISTYVIKLKPRIYYQPHPAFAKDNNGTYYYHRLSERQARGFHKIADFKYTASRELVADDYVLQIKRLADPNLNSPIFGFLSPYIVGLTELNKELNNKNIDLRTHEFAGAKVIDQYTYEINIHGKYPQFIYWLAMPFFAPVPWEALVFYAQPGLAEHNISLDWYPVGTGAYYLAENNPNRRMVLVRNPNFHDEYYPTEGELEDETDGLLADAGKKLPFIDQIIFSLEKENIPYWDKFLQGYYDSSGLSSDTFNSAISSTSQAGLELTKPLQDKNIRLEVSNMPSIFYWAFNMLDDTVGGYSDQARKLRKAISLVFDVEEYLVIFTNGRGLVANDPIPPDIFGHTAAEIKPQAENISLAKQLLTEAGYQDGRNQKTGAALQINFEAVSSGDPEEKAHFAWLTKQLAKLGIDLIIRATDYNRFMEKTKTGNAQMFAWGWNADYPDPENFLYMFYSGNGKVKFGGENAANYANLEFDRLFTQFKSIGNSPARLAMIKKMLSILEIDKPWIWGYYPQSYVLFNAWDKLTKPSGIAVNTLKYAKLDPILRAKQRLLWNQPILWPVPVAIILLFLIILPAIIGYRRSENSTGKRLN